MPALQAAGTPMVSSGLPGSRAFVVAGGWLAGAAWFFVTQARRTGKADCRRGLSSRLSGGCGIIATDLFPQPTPRLPFRGARRPLPPRPDINQLSLAPFAGEG